MSELRIAPLNPDRWDDLVRLFGDRGASSGCWCMWFRARPKDWTANGNAGHRAALRGLVETGAPVGLLAYAGAAPVGWASVAPREQHVRIAGEAGTPAPAHDPGPVWSITCFYVEARRRSGGIARTLLDAAVAHAFAGGAAIVEGYPVEPDGRTSNAAAFHGTRAMFEAAGFTEAGRFDRWPAAPGASGPHPSRLVRPPGRPVMRLARPTPRDGDPVTDPATSRARARG